MLGAVGHEEDGEYADPSQETLCVEMSSGTFSYGLLGTFHWGAGKHQV